MQKHANKEYSRSVQRNPNSCKHKVEMSLKGLDKPPEFLEPYYGDCVNDSSGMPGPANVSPFSYTFLYSEPVNSRGVNYAFNALQGIFPVNPKLVVSCLTNFSLSSLCSYHPYLADLSEDQVLGTREKQPVGAGTLSKIINELVEIERRIGRS